MYRLIFSSYLCEVKSTPNIRELTFDQLSEAIAEFGEKSFRAKQIYDWLWNKSARSFDQMNNVPLSLRNKLAEKFAFTPICVAHEQRSNDRTIKYGFKLHDGHLIEGVLIPTASRMTACVSSQVGCSLSCKFCATGKLDRVRNLNADEIYDQVAIIREQSMAVYNIPLSNIVYMGMGEPLLNYANVLSSIERITAANGLGMSPQRITVSTAGIAKMITKLGDDEVKFNLALSLHAANDSKRDKIMPINEHNNLEVLSDALKYFYDKTGTRVTYEFIVFNNFNDSLKDAQELAEFAKHVPCKINLIEYNAIGDGVFEKARLDRLEVFKNYLESKNLVVNIRRSRGKDIDAACGQLANKNQ
ncbi:MAG TPA: 23S rRNA (adenine(2503)-C(2))-methyltransferase RlmN [Bacteroidia bacterium]|nr:23S rRNA (adenine(2503)-C(2))-methyltransferase RlmN [Bacteroidia bacterium]HRC90873.1 23S rRNA (adenine(2503)-C(2))-methyltransferase RlmN [Bacteroidia bacterium]HRF14253.1 23S rRNA (adenine(2503)-C(2))-methyltransferase RlmN [Bacteroidia bacterium]HRH83918.1 23S rRNA (adenine(2503)-C(2))-methyltransferase RlmN [Bacteroidia bacterium]HRU17056.1 23S rRNA (adenine(2503)-C(2))-methyltransferase RlmN [Bacteroidia bacterium]